MTIEVEPLTACIGAEIDGVDLRTGLDDESFAAVHDAFHEFGVVFFHDQPLEPLELLDLARRFGALDIPHPLLPCRPEDPRVAVVLNNEDRPPHNAEWHSDVTFVPEPPLGSLLQALVLPPRGGDTLWSSMTALYDDLPQTLQERLLELSAWHSIETFSGGIHDSEDGERVRQAMRENPPTLHPMVRTHPVTGRKALFVNEIFTTAVECLPAEESDDLLRDLFERVRKPEYQVRFRWREGSIAIWDNRCTQHYAVADYFPAKRLMHRVTVAGDRPFLAGG